MVRTLLLLGGMTPDVTMLYYNTINRVVRSHLGGRSSAPLFLYNADLETMIQHASRKDWASFASVYKDPIKALSSAPQRIEGIVVCAILAHKVSKELSMAADLPFLHIADCVSKHLKSEYPQIKRVGLLGPKATMLDAEDPDFFIGRLQSAQHGYEVIVPEGEENIREVDRGMFEEVAKGKASVTELTKAMFVSQASALVDRGAQAIILGSTDLGFVFQQESLPAGIPVIEPAEIHASQVALWALEG